MWVAMYLSLVAEICEITPVGSKVKIRIKSNKIKVKYILFFFSFLVIFLFWKSQRGDYG